MAKKKDPIVEATEEVVQPMYVRLYVAYTGTLSDYHTYKAGVYAISDMPTALVEHLVDIGEADYVQAH